MTTWSKIKTAFKIILMIVLIASCGVALKPVAKSFQVLIAASG
jgi:hypothetical protein